MTFLLTMMFIFFNTNKTEKLFMINNLNIQNVIQTPLSYLLQNYTKDEILAIQDENGWNIVHYACMWHDFSKTHELFFHNFDFFNISLNNKIPPKQMGKIFKNILESECSIYLSNGGYSGLHLLSFIIYSLEYKLNNNINDFQYSDKHKNYLDYFHFLIKHGNTLLNIKDAHGLSVSDYCILFESPSLINIIFQEDIKFESLQSVSLKTLENILLIHKEKAKSIPYKFKLQNLEYMIEKVQKIQTFNHINNKIIKKDDENTKMVKI